MHVRVRLFGKPEAIVVVESKLTKIDKFRQLITNKFDIDVKLQLLFYGGKLLEDGYTFHDYNIKLNDVIQLMVKPKAKQNSPDKSEDTNDQGSSSSKNDEKSIAYKNASSSLYAVGDLIDMRDQEQGAWFEGAIVRIVLDPTSPLNAEDTNINNADSGSDLENQPPAETDVSNVENPSKSPKKGIEKYFSKITGIKKTITDKEFKTKDAEQKPRLITEQDLLYQVHIESEEDHYCKSKDIRPRARTEIDIEQLTEGQTVMINHNTDQPQEKGYWYDFTVKQVKKHRTSHELIGTLYLGPDAIPQNDTKVKVLDKIFAIEKVIPLENRTDEHKEMMKKETEKRSQPLRCLVCRDDETVLCKSCGCFLCSGKEEPEKTVLCDECDNGYHMHCLKPPLLELPKGDWYCPTCKRDPNEVVAPGAAKQTKKSSRSTTGRDWGRGMACVGKTKTCAMPPNHFGPIPGIEVGMRWRFRIQLSETGVHRPPVSGIHGRDVEGAYSIVLSGGYEDDYDNGYEFTYTGSGGRDLSGNKRTAGQSCDQTLTRENKALARNCAVKQISESGADAGDEWRNGKPVRVVRSFKMAKHFPKFAPDEGIRYDGIYKVVKYYPEKGLSGYRVWKYLLRRDDPIPAPWEPEAKSYAIIYPDGYMEAEAEKKAQKRKKVNSKKVVKDSSDSEEEKPSKAKKRKYSGADDSMEGKSEKKAQKEKIVKPKSSESNDTEGEKSPKGIRQKKSKSSKTNAFKTNKIADKKQSKITDCIAATNSAADTDHALSDEERETIKGDQCNAKLWDECLDIRKTKGKKAFVEHVTQAFLCIICQEVVANPTTTPCLHNFCMGCLKLAFKSTGSQTCPCCRQNLSKHDPERNEQLTAALRAIMPGYDAGRK